MSEWEEARGKRVGGGEGCERVGEGEGVSEWEKASSEWVEGIFCKMVLYVRALSIERCKDHRAI